MRAFTLDSFDTRPGPREDLPTPQVGPDQLLVRVQASSVNPVDAFIAAGYLKAMAEHEFPVALGRDYAGVIEQVGPAVTGYAPGDEVYGWLLHANPTVHEGSWVELIAIPQGGSVARRPASVDVAQAGAAPLAALTALAASDALELGAGATVLVVGASGGVGSFTVQLAAHAGATVLAPGLAEDQDHLRGLGAAEVLDRNADSVAAVRERYPDGVDALLDLVSSDPEALNAYAAVVRDGGRIASSVGAAGQGPGRTNVGALPGRENLERLAGLLADGTLRVPIQASYPLAQVDQALKTLGGQHTQGKLAITLP
jgi:NADPH2:quinone reductase